MVAYCEHLLDDPAVIEVIDAQVPGDDPRRGVCAPLDQNLDRYAGAGFEGADGAQLNIFVDVPRNNLWMDDPTLEAVTIDGAPDAYRSTSVANHPYVSMLDPNNGVRVVVSFRNTNRIATPDPHDYEITEIVARAIAANRF
jgi:hypothetical protein